MKFNKIFAAVLAVCIIGAALPVYQDSCSDYAITASSADYKDVTENDIKYRIYRDSVEVKKYSGTQSTVIIPSELYGLPVTSIGDSAFSSCESLTSVTIPNSVTKIGNFAFSECKNLESIDIPYSVTEFGTGAFAGTKWLETMQERTGRLVIGGNNVLIDGSTCYGNRTIEVPDYVTKIGDGAFFGAFSNCSITSIKIPDSVTSIGYDAFRNCTSLKSIKIPIAVTSIKLCTFQNCTSLESIEIPKSVKSIEDNAFNNCTTLTDVYYDGTEEEWSHIYIESGNDCLKNATIHFNSDETTAASTTTTEATSTTTTETTSTTTTETTSTTTTETTSTTTTETTSTTTTETTSATTTETTSTTMTSTTAENSWLYVGKTEITLKESEQYTINANQTGLIYKSHNTDVAVVSKSGVITAWGEGTAVISIMNSDGDIVQIKVTVTSANTAEITYGDANSDGKVSISDAVSILQYLANASKYPLDGQAKENADCDGQAGVTGKDAAAIQLYDAGVIDTLPVK